MTENRAILEIKYRIDTATQAVGAGIDGKAYEDLEIAIQALEKVQAFEATGTIEEFKALKEKNIPKEPIKIKTDEKILYMCPSCRKIFIEAYDTVQRGYIPKFCEMCGQDIKWSWGQ